MSLMSLILFADSNVVLSMRPLLALSDDLSESEGNNCSFMGFLILEFFKQYLAKLMCIPRKSF